MSRSPNGDGSSQAGTTRGDANRRGLLGTGVRSVLLFLLITGAFGWALRTWWLNNHPVQAAAQGLQSGDPTQRIAAIRQLWDLGTSASAEVIDTPIPAVKDPDANVRATAVQALGIVGAYAIRAGADPRAPEAVVAALMEALKDSDPSVRGASASALGGIVGTATRPASSGRGAPDASKKAATPAPSINSEEVTTRLFDLVADPDTNVRQAVLNAIRQISPRRQGDPPKSLFAALEDPSSTTRMMAVSTLVTFSHGLDPLIPALLRGVSSGEQPVRDECVKALGEIRPSALTPAVLPGLIASLKSPDRDVRMRLASLVGRMSPEPGTAVPALITVLHEKIDSDETAGGAGGMTVAYAGPAQEAARALGRIAPRTSSADQAIAALTEVARSGPPKRRAAAAEALGQFGPAAASAAPTLVALLQAALANKEPTADGPAAASSLGKVAPDTPAAAPAVIALTAALDCPFSNTRHAAMRALGSFGHAADGSIPKVRSIQEKDLDPNMRKAAVSTLKALEGKAK